jgi:hypothetical protein
MLRAEFKNDPSGAEVKVFFLQNLQRISGSETLTRTTRNLQISTTYLIEVYLAYAIRREI